MNKTQLLITLFLLIIPSITISQNVEDEVFDFESFQMVDSVNNEKSFDQLIIKINSYAKTDVQKLSIAALWISENIDFDMGQFKNGTAIPDYKTVNDTRKGVCGAYTIIFAEFCNRFNITNEIIEGYAPEYGSKNEMPTETNHVWNVVKLRGKWYHCDLQGFTGFLKQGNNSGFEFVKRKNYKSFMTRDIEFLTTHIPGDPIWQLSNNPKKINELVAYEASKKSNSYKSNFDYKEKIEKYVSLSGAEKKLTFADNAYSYNPNNCNSVIINYFNAAVDLFNSSDGRKEILIKARTYFEKALQPIENTENCNTYAYLKPEIRQALEIIKKYVP